MGMGLPGGKESVGQTERLGWTYYSEESENVSRSVLSDSFRPHGTVACHAPLSMAFSQQKYWSGLPFPSPGDLPDPGMEPELFMPPTRAKKK